MQYLIKRRKMVKILVALLLLVLLTVGMEKYRYDRTMQEGDCMESLVLSLKTVCRNR